MSELAETPSFGALLRQHRQTLDLTQAAFAERAGVAARTIQDLERGIANPRRATAQRIVAALSLTAEASSQIEAALSPPRRRVGPATLDARRAGRHGLPLGMGGPVIVGRVWTGQRSLPTPLTSFVGRERELAEVARLLETTRLVTLTGVGGVGKTRLAIETARAVQADHVDGACLVELAGLGDPELVPRAVADALGVPEQLRRPPAETLVDALRNRRVMLVLDNCEHLVVSCATLVDRLLSACAWLRVLATGREPLGVAGEAIWRVPPLTVPSGPPVSVTNGPSTEYGAVTLFVDRAGLARPGFNLTESNVSAVVEICRRLDGIPLAIELAAARMSAMSVSQIVERLDDQLALLTRAPRTAAPRQRTLRATLDWSYGLLSKPEQTLLLRLSVFAGGWTLDAAEVVCAGAEVSRDEILDLLTRLVDASLVVADERAGATRYRLLEPVRQYAAERLRLVGDEPSVRRRHAQHALALAEQAEPQLVRASAGVRLDRLAVEHDNLRAALAWSVDAGGSEELTARLAGSLWKFWWLRGHLDEGRRWLVRALGATCTPTARIKVLAGAGSLADYQNDYIQAEQLYREMLTLARASDDRVSTSLALNRLSDLKRLNTEDEQGTALAEESVVLARESGDELSVTLALATLGRAWIARGDHARAASAFEESMAVAREHGFVVTLSHTQGQLARILSVRGDIPRAITLCDEALDRFQQLGDRWGRESALRNRMSIARLQGDHERVIDLAAEALMLGHELGNRLALINTVARLAWAARQRGDPARAARMLGAADAIRDAVRVRLPEPDRSVFEADVATVRAMLGEAGFAEAWAEGRAMSLEQAVAYAMEDAGREEVAEPRPPA